jgi:hypothetical protein
MLISTIFPPLNVKPSTENGCPLRKETTPAAPLTSAGRTTKPSREKTSACSATARAPRTNLDAPALGAAIGSEHDLRIEDGEKRFEIPAVRAAKKASTTSRCRLRSMSGTGTAPCTRLRARLASCLAAVADRPTMGAISSNDTANIVVEDESKTFGGIESFKYHEQSKPNRVSQQHCMLRVDQIVAAHDRFGDMRVEGFLTP